MARIETARCIKNLRRGILYNMMSIISCDESGKSGKSLGGGNGGQEGKKKEEERRGGIDEVEYKQYKQC